MSSEQQPEFPATENPQQGQVAFESMRQELAQGRIRHQSTTRRIPAIFLTHDGFFAEIICGDSEASVSTLSPEREPYLTATIGRYPDKTFSPEDLAAPGSLQALFSGAFPKERMFWPNGNIESDLSDDSFELALQRLQEDLPAATVGWIHEALRITWLPAEHSSTPERVDRIIELAKDVPDVPLELSALITMEHIRAIGGWTLDAVWQSANQTLVVRNKDLHQTQTRIELKYLPGNGQRYFYERDSYGKEKVAAEVDDPAELDVLSAIGYDVDTVGNWQRNRWDASKGKLRDSPPAPDSALEDFARRVQNTLAATRLDDKDRYFALPDGTYKVRRADGTTY